MGAMRLHDQTKEAKWQDNPSKRDKYGLIVFETTRQISNTLISINQINQHMAYI